MSHEPLNAVQRAGLQRSRDEALTSWFWGVVAAAAVMALALFVGWEAGRFWPLP